MKNIISILSLLFGAMVACISCNREEISGADMPVEDGMPIAFFGLQTWVDTKAGTEDGSEEDITQSLPETFTKFNVWASRVQAVNGENQPFEVFNETTVEKTGSGATVAWSYSPIRYWQPGTYNFYAVSPTSISSSIPISGTLTSAGLSLAFGELSGNQYSGWDLSQNQVDLLMASNTDFPSHYNLSENNPVELTFDHILSKLTFSVGNKSTDNDIIVTAIKLYGNHKKATGYTSSLSWITDSKSVSNSPFVYTEKRVSLYKLESDGQIGYSEILKDLLVFPETCKITVEVTLKLDANSSSNGYTKSSGELEVTWTTGKHYHYQIKVAPDNISFSEPKVIDWVDGGKVDSDIEM